MTGATAASFISGPLQQNPVALGPPRPACQARTIARARRQPNGGRDFHGQAGGDCRDCRIDTLPRHRRDLGAGDNAPPMRILQHVNRPIASRTGAPGDRPGARLRIGGMQLASKARAALFPDFAVEPRPDDAAVPLARLGEGLLRAPPYAGATACLNAVALSVSMLDAALAEYPPERVVVLASDRVRPRLGTALAAAAARGACIVSSEIAPLPAVDGAAEVYSTGGEIGFLALLADRAVKAFAASFYTGWGLTADAAGIPRHGFSRTLDEVFAAHSLVAARYRDPFRDAPASFEDTLALLAEWRRIDI